MRTQNNYFDTRFSFDARRDAVWGQIVKYLQRYIPSTDKVIELGTGYGSFINQVRAGEKHALDISDVSREHLDQDVIFHPGSSCNMKDIPSSYFDCVFASNLLEHLTEEELQTTLLEVRRVLKEGGKFIVLQPNFRYSYKVYFDDYTHKQVFTHFSLANLLQERGFAITKILPRFIPFSMKSSIPKSVFLVWLYLRIPFKPFAGQMLILSKKAEGRS